LAEELADALRVDRVGYSHLEHGAGESAAALPIICRRWLQPHKGTTGCADLLSFTFVGGLTSRFRLPDARARLQ
jgi:hypothetical protein